MLLTKSMAIPIKKKSLYYSWPPLLDTSEENHIADVGDLSIVDVFPASVSKVSEGSTLG